MGNFVFLKISIFLLLLFFAFSSLATTLQPPNLIFPTSNDSPLGKGQIEFHWSSVSGANYYQYHINLPDGTSKGKIVSQTIIKIYDLPLGAHSWTVRSCEDKAAQICSSWSPLENFDIIAMAPELTKGLVPCGRLYDNPNTLINESKPCEFTDIFVLFKRVLDFILWRMGPTILVLLIIATGVIFYFSMGGPMVMAQAKSILRSALLGYGLIFLAWLIITLILRILGYTLSKWWSI